MTVVATPEQTQAQAPVPGSPEHDAQLAAVFDSRQQPQTQQPAATSTPDQKPAVPDFVPEKFRSAEDPLKAMAEAYAALEAKQAAAAPKPAAAPAAVEPPKPGEAPTAEQAQAAAQAAGLDFNALSTKYMETGSLAAEDYAALEKSGIPKSMVDSYIAGQEAIANSMRNDIFQTVGGEDKFTSMAEWAGKNMPKADVLAFNQVMETGSAEQVKLAVAGLNARYLEAVGSEPNLLGGNASTTQDVFRSVQQLTEAMRDPRYAKDPAYRADVEAKLARSSIM
jgi:hypothetical protein